MTNSNIVVVINCGNLVGGAEINLREYLRQVQGFNFILITSKAPNVMEFFSDIGPKCKKIYHSKYFPTKKKHFTRFYNIFLLLAETIFIRNTLQKISKEFNISLVYVNNTIATVSMGIIACIQRKKYNCLAHIHDMMSFSTFSPLVLLFGRYLNRFITVSQATKEDLVKTCKIDKDIIGVIYNGINLRKYHSLPNKKDPTRAFSIGFVGGLTYRKGVHILIEAFKAINEKHPRSKLLISYSYKDTDYFETISKELEQIDNVWCGTYDTDKIMNFYHLIDVLVVPSLRDPLPTVILEAMACDNIVIGSRIDGIPEMLSEEFLFQPNNALEIELKISEIMQDYPRYKKLSILKNRECLQTKFSLALSHEKLNTEIQTHMQKIP